MCHIRSLFVSGSREKYDLNETENTACGQSPLLAGLSVAHARSTKYWRDLRTDRSESNNSPPSRIIFHSLMNYRKGYHSPMITIIWDDICQVQCLLSSL